MNEVHGASGAYVADALDTTERAEFEDHLANCELCRREVAEFHETLAQLSVVTEVAPPVELRSSVLAAIGSVAQLPPLGDGPRHARSPLDLDDEPVAPVVTPSRTESRTAAVTSTAPVDELALRRARKVRRALTLAVAAVAVIALALGGWVVGLQRQADQQRVVAGRQADLSAAQSRVLAASDAKVYPVKMQDQSAASWVVSKKLDQAVFISPDAANLPADRLYQLWTVTGAGPRSLGVVTTGGDQRVLVDGVSNAAALAVTVEPSNGGRGSKAPSMDPFAVAQF